MFHRTFFGLFSLEGGTSAMKKRIVQLLLAAAGLLCLGVGLAQGGYQTTLAKAVRICMECIGIG